MTPIRIFVSSVQREFAAERTAVRDYLRGDPLMRRFFEVFLGPMYLAKYIERMGTGIRDMIERCRAVGLGEPEFTVDAGTWVTTIRRKAAGRDSTPEVTPEGTPEVTPEVLQMLTVVTGEMSRAEIMQALGLSDEKHFREHYQQVAVAAGLLEMTRPETPQSPRQKYRLTERGKDVTRRIEPTTEDT